MIMGTFGKSTSTILYHAVDDAFLIERINSATRDVSLTAPGISMAVASAMMKAVSRLDGRVQLLVDATPESFHLGYNDPQVIRFLQQGCRKEGLHTFYSESGLRVGVLTVDDATTIFTPGVLTLEKLSPVTVWQNEDTAHHIVDERDKYDLDKLNPIIYDEERREYRAVGEKGRRCVQGRLVVPLTPLANRGILTPSPSFRLGDGKFNM